MKLVLVNDKGELFTVTEQVEKYNLGYEKDISELVQVLRLTRIEVAQGSVVSDRDRCPQCGEYTKDRLIWSEENTCVICQTCGTKFVPPSKHGGNDESDQT